MWRKPKQIPALQRYENESHDFPPETPPAVVTNAPPTRTLLRPIFTLALPPFSDPRSTSNAEPIEHSNPLSFEVILNQVGYDLAQIMQGCDAVEMGSLHELPQLTALVHPAWGGDKGSACVKSNAPSRSESYSLQERLLKCFSEYLRREKKFYVTNRIEPLQREDANVSAFALLSSKSKDACRSLGVSSTLIGLTETLVIVHVHRKSEQPIEDNKERVFR